MNASYVSTGNGGPDFEVDVAAVMLVRVLTGTSDRLLGTQQHVPERVTLQDRTGPDGFDDVGVACVSLNADGSRVYIQAKRGFAFTESDGFPQLMRGVHDFDMRDQGKWSAVLAMGDAPSETADVEELCELARGSASAAEFGTKVGSPGATNERKRRFLQKLNDALQGTEDGASWRVLQRLRVPDCDYHRADSRDRQMAIDALSRFLPTRSQAQALKVFDLLRAEVLRSGKTATGYGRAALLDSFQGSLGFAKDAKTGDSVSAEQLDPTATAGHDLAAVIGAITAESAKQAPGQGNEAPASRREVQDLMEGQNKIKEMLEVFMAKQRPDAVQAAIPKDDLSADKRSEDAAMHERIDVARDLMLDGEPHPARKQLLGMLQAGRAEGKPYAQFRIRTNLASICLYLGEFGEAAEGYEAAYVFRPDEPHAKANLALARLLQDRFEEAMALAQEALQGPEPVEAAVSYLLQAASRSSWTGDLKSLVPPAFEHGVQADLGLAEFIRRRECPGWEEASLEMADRHPDASEFRPVEAVAALSLAIKSGQTIGGGIGPVPFTRLNQIADRMQDFVRKMLRTGFADPHDRVAHLNNACVLLRMCDRYKELEELLRSAGPLADEDPNLRRLRALALVHIGRRAEAIRHLRNDGNIENMILHADLVGNDDPLKGVELLLGLDETLLDDRLKWVRWQAVALLSDAAGVAEHLVAAVAALGTLSPSDPEVAVMDALLSRLRGAEEAEVKGKLIAAAGLLDASSPMHARFFVASRLHSFGLAQEASTLLDGMVDLDRPSATVALYLACLADARRDGRFRQTLSAAAASVRDDTPVLWTTAQHAWNMGDLEVAETAIVTLNGRFPDNLRWRLFRLDLLLRQNRDDDVRTALEAPLENCAEQTKQDLLKLTAILGHYGFLMRAGRLAYRMFLERQNDPAAWTAIFRLVLADAGQAGPSVWNCPAVGEDAAVDIRYDDGEVGFFIVEPNPDLCSRSPDSLEPVHPLVRSLWGLAKDAPFTAPNGKTGRITELRHKVVAQLHRVLRDFGERFPGVNAFQKLEVAPADPKGLDELKEVLRRQDVSSKEATANYAKGEWSVAMLALALRKDQVEAAAIAVANDGQLRVAIGAEFERLGGIVAVRRGRAAGATLDHLTFWTAWCIGAMDNVKEVFGKIRVPRSVQDEILERLHEARSFRHDGRRQAMYRGSQLRITEYTPEYVRGEVEHIEGALAWLADNAEICPVILEDDSAPALRQMYREGHTSMLDALLVSIRTETTFVSDDLWMRNFAASLKYPHTAWTHAILLFANEASIIDRRRYVELISLLIGFGQSYIGISGQDFMEALRIAPPGAVLGGTFEQLVRPLGGDAAEIFSHCAVTKEFLIMLWADGGLADKRRAATSLVMRHLLRTRHADYGAIFRDIRRAVGSNVFLYDFLNYWATGHFFPAHEITGREPRRAKQQPPTQRRRKRR